MLEMMFGVEGADDSTHEAGLDGLDEPLVAQPVNRVKVGGPAYQMPSGRPGPGGHQDLHRAPAARNSFRYAGRQHPDAPAETLRPVYTAPTETAARERFTKFTETWDSRYQTIVR